MVTKFIREYSPENLVVQDRLLFRINVRTQYYDSECSEMFDFESSEERDACLKEMDAVMLNRRK